jgi:hypothetical protein
MIKTKSQHQTYGVTQYHAERPVLTQPVITKEYFEGKGKDKVRMYKGENGRVFIAEAFDRMFKVIPGNVRAKHFKGANPHRAKEVLK